MNHFPKIPGIFFFINCRIFNTCYICTHWQYHVHCDFDFKVTSDQVHDTFSWAIFDPSMGFLLFYSHFWTGHESGTSIWTDGHRERRVEMKLCWHYNEILCISLSLIRLVESRVCGDAEGVGGWGGGLDILVLIMKYFSFPSRGRGYKEVVLLLYFCHTVEPFWIYWVYVNTFTEQAIL